jgi:UDP-glucose 4-epimerase
MSGKSRIVITGGAGYIGAHTAVQLIESGFEVIVIDNLSRSDTTLLKGIEGITGRTPSFYEIDCADYQAMDKVFSENSIDAVIHFAAYKAVGESVAKPLDYFENNILTLTTLLRVMQKHNVEKLIFSSSCTVYGEPDTVPVTERSPIKPANSPYGATKQMCERILQDVQPQGLSVVSLRYFNPIGAHPSGLIGELPLGIPNNLVPFITQTASGVRSTLTIFGNDYNTSDGTCVRDYIHVTDLAEAHVRALQYLSTPEGRKDLHFFNVGTGEGHSVRELIEQFQEVNNLSLSVVVGPRRPGDVEKIYADPRLAFDRLQWRPRFTLKDSLKHAWQWEKRIRNLDIT